MLKKIEAYVSGIALPVLVGLLSAWITRDNMNLYDSIIRPPLAPPAILFPIAWTVLYVLMGIGSTLIFRSGATADEKRPALTVYGLQLVVNFFWSILFFNLRAFLLSLVWLCLLWVLILVMILRFRKLHPIAAWLQLPYLAWVSFAGYLNLMIYLLN